MSNRFLSCGGNVFWLFVSLVVSCTKLHGWLAIEALLLFADDLRDRFPVLVLLVAGVFSASMQVSCTGC